MTRSVIRTDRAPAAIGPYSQGIAYGGLVFCAGQIPLDPATGTLVAGGIREQARRVVENLEAVLREAGAGLGSVLRLDVYMTDLSGFPQVNDLLSDVFRQDPPARVTVQVAALPMGAEIEMAAIAAL
ncbi:MAG: hypothetical protein JSV00_10280 [bacterium]|nr:MAG: hypothetical protein JSV00_10280 [bacterium]